MKNIFGSNSYRSISKNYFLHLKAHFLEEKTLFFDSKKIFLIANTFSLRLPAQYKFLSVNFRVISTFLTEPLSANEFSTGLAEIGKSSS